MLASKDNDGKKILIAYHSGSGSTEMIGSVIADRLKNRHNVDIIEIRPNLDRSRLKDYDLVIIGFPTYYFRPSLSAMEFVEGLPDQKGKAFFIFTTYGLYSGNSIRVLSDIIRKRNGQVMGYTQVRGPASDGVLLFPSIKLFFRYERDAAKKINKAVYEIETALTGDKEKERVPRKRWYSPFTAVFRHKLGKLEYTRYRSNLRLIRQRCTKCNICVNNCIRSCWVKGGDHPSIDTGDCEFCLRCVHNCPERAIIFSDAMVDRSRLDKEFYALQKERLSN